jgi:formylglycine-generating enzyme required for sulfatase activity
LLELLESSGASARILILDACRNNPLRKRSIGRGLVGMDGSGTLVVFPTQAGKTTPDNGLFRRELLKGLRQRGISADDALKRIGRAVYQSSKGDQVPAIYGLLLEDFAFVPGAAAPIVNPGIPPVKPEPPTAIVTGPRQGDKKVGPDGQTYVYIAPATFQMGCSAGDNECDADEKPVTVTLTKGYWIGETEVTQEAYSKVTRQNPSHFEGPRRPVEQVNWEDAAAYCGKARMRLPTEAEWEYAARGGSGEAYFDDVSAIGWYSTNSGMETHEVKGKRANGYGLYDMQGNVWEWVQDWYVDRLAGGTDPRGPRSGERRVLRGGSWWGLPTFLRVSCRSRFVPSIRFELHGFRCAGE